MRIAAVHKFISNKSRVINPSGSLSKIVTHPSCPQRRWPDKKGDRIRLALNVMKLQSARLESNGIK